MNWDSDPQRTNRTPHHVAALPDQTGLVVRRLGRQARPHPPRAAPSL